MNNAFTHLRHSLFHTLLDTNLSEEMYTCYDVCRRFKLGP